MCFLSYRDQIRVKMGLKIAQLPTAGAAAGALPLQPQDRIPQEERERQPERRAIRGDLPEYRARTSAYDICR